MLNLIQTVRDCDMDCTSNDKQQRHIFELQALSWVFCQKQKFDEEFYYRDAHSRLFYLNLLEIESGRVIAMVGLYHGHRTTTRTDRFRYA